ncbi:MAG TPA: DUF5996 family protein [Burkholderiales bacterium]|nr:DUF5996 family protein [Burkholderiales bacterium]
MTKISQAEVWPELPYERWKESCATLHLWTQVVGKIRLVQSPWLNHSWHVPLYVTARGLTTSSIAHAKRAFDIEFDFVDHTLVLRTSDGATRELALRPRTVADFYAAVMAALEELELPVTIDRVPNEIADAIPFDQDTTHRAYDAESAQRFWRILVQVNRVLSQFRTSFLGKCSPVHFFWGSFDLAVTRFSGRTAPKHPGGVPHLADAVVREAYSHEVSSAGFWPGGNAVEYAAFYSYAYPEPVGFRKAPIRPAGAFFNEALGEFLLPYDVVRTAADPDSTLLEFLRSTYEAAADAGAWDREALECVSGRARVPRTVP